MDVEAWLPQVAMWLDARSIATAMRVCRSWHRVLRFGSELAWFGLLAENSWASSKRTSDPYARFSKLATIEHRLCCSSLRPAVATIASEAPALCVAFLGSARLMFSGKSGDVTTWTPRARSSVHTHVTDFTVYSLGYDRRSRWVAAGSADGAVHAWKLGDAEPQLGSVFCRALDGQHTSTVRRVVVCGETAFSASKDGSLRRWDLPKQTCVSAFVGHASEVHCLAVCESRGVLISGSSDHYVVVWDMDNPERRAALRPRHTGWVTCVACNDSLIVSASEADLRVWPMLRQSDLGIGDFQLPQLRWPYQLLTGHRAMINCLVLKDDFILSGGNDSLVCVWQKHSSGRYSPKHTLCGHGASSWVNCLAAHPFARVAASGDSEGVVILWNYDEGKQLRMFHDPSSSAVLDIAFSRHCLAFASWRGVVTCIDFSGKAAATSATSPQPTPALPQMTTEERIQRFPHSALLRVIRKP